MSVLARKHLIKRYKRKKNVALISWSNDIETSKNWQVRGKKEKEEKRGEKLQLIQISYSTMLSMQ